MIHEQQRAKQRNDGPQVLEADDQMLHPTIFITFSNRQSKQL